MEELHQQIMQLKPDYVEHTIIVPVNICLPILMNMNAGSTEEIEGRDYLMMF